MNHIIQPHHLPLNSSKSYWIAVQCKIARSEMEAIGFRLKDGIYLTHTAQPWLDTWYMLVHLNEKIEQHESSLAAVIPTDTEPSTDEIRSKLKPFSEMQAIVDSLWLGDALMDDRLTCFLQPVVDKRRKIFGYEAFARIRQKDESLVSGYSIIAASKVLQLEYRLDRYLHQKAIEAFTESEYSSRLFINFMPGFIHRAEVYLDGLMQEVRRHGLPSQSIILDVTQVETQKNIDHLKTIRDYCYSQGYGLSLDDVQHPETARMLASKIKPDYLKLDMRLVRELPSAKALSEIQQMVDIAHKNGITIIGEGIESEEVLETLIKIDVDLFQGYYIGEPLPACSLSQKVNASR